MCDMCGVLCDVRRAPSRSPGPHRGVMEGAVDGELALAVPQPPLHHLAVARHVAYLTWHFFDDWLLQGW